MNATQRESTTTVSTLNLVLNHRRHEATRVNDTVEFGGRCQLWIVLTVLAKAYDGFLEKRDLIGECWAAEYPINDTTLYSTVSELRDRLRLLKLSIKHVKGLGYRLASLEAPSPGTRSISSKPRRRQAGESKKR